MKLTHDVGRIPGLLLAALLLAGCWPQDNPQVGLTSLATPKAKLAARHFESCDDYRSYFSASLSRELLEGWAPCWGCQGFMLEGAPSMASPGGPPAPSDGALGASGGFRDVSGTNTQEAGVDEADLIKADARGYFYLARGPELLVIRASPADQMNVAYRLNLKGSGYGQARSLYLDAENNRLVVMIDAAGPNYPGTGAYPARYGTGLLFLDISDPVAPVATDWLWTEGYMFDSRRVDRRLHLVSTHNYWWPTALSESSGFHQRLQAYYQARQDGRKEDAERLAGEIRSDVNQAVAATPLGQLLPLRKSGLGEGEPQPLACESVLHTDVEHRLGLMLITSVDTDGGNPAALATINNAWQLYASQDYLYLAQYSGGWWFDRRQTEQTAIYRFELTEGAVQPAGFGVVDGWTRDSYSFGEHQGFLRVATTEGRFREDLDRWVPSNHLFVLGAATDGNLKTVGQVRDFMRDERIFSSRFLGDRGYVVTFRQVDPLFVFDLSDATAPKVTGQVEIPGFSTYIHPLDENHLLTIGRDGDGTGVNHNIRLQIFDVTNPAAPALAHFFVPEVNAEDWVFSLAEYDPHAFTYYGPEKLLSIPVQIGSGYSERSFSGFLALRADAQAGFSAPAWIDHKATDSGGSGCPDQRDIEAPCESFAPVYYHWPQRSVVGAEASRTVLFTLSSATLKSGDLADLSVELDSLDLRPN